MESTIDLLVNQMTRLKLTEIWNYLNENNIPEDVQNFLVNYYKVIPAPGRTSFCLLCERPHSPNSSSFNCPFLAHINPETIAGHTSCCSFDSKEFSNKRTNWHFIAHHLHSKDKIPFGNDIVLNTLFYCCFIFPTHVDLIYCLSAYLVFAGDDITADTGVEGLEEAKKNFTATMDSMFLTSDFMSSLDRILHYKPLYDPKMELLGRTNFWTDQGRINSNSDGRSAFQMKDIDDIITTIPAIVRNEYKILKQYPIGGDKLRTGSTYQIWNVEWIRNVYSLQSYECYRYYNRDEVEAFLDAEFAGRKEQYTKGGKKPKKKKSVSSSSTPATQVTPTPVYPEVVASARRTATTTIGTAISRTTSRSEPSTTLVVEEEEDDDDDIIEILDIAGTPLNNTPYRSSVTSDHNYKTRKRRASTSPVQESEDEEMNVQELSDASESDASPLPAKLHAHTPKSIPELIDELYDKFAETTYIKIKGQQFSVRDLRGIFNDEVDLSIDAFNFVLKNRLELEEIDDITMLDKSNIDVADDSFFVCPTSSNGKVLLLIGFSTKEIMTVIHIGPLRLATNVSQDLQNLNSHFTEKEIKTRAYDVSFDANSNFKVLQLFVMFLDALKIYEVTGENFYKVFKHIKKHDTNEDPRPLVKLILDQFHTPESREETKKAIELSQMLNFVYHGT